MSIKKRLKKIFYCILSVALVCSGLFCAAVRISNSGIDASFDIIAAQTAMPTGTAQYSEPPEISETVTANTEPSVIPEESSHEDRKSTRLKAVMKFPVRKAAPKKKARRKISSLRYQGNSRRTDFKLHRYRMMR